MRRVWINFFCWIAVLRVAHAEPGIVATEASNDNTRKYHSKPQASIRLEQARPQESIGSATATALPKSRIGQSQSMVMMSMTSKIKLMLHPWLSDLQMAAILTTIALQLSPLRSCSEIRKESDVKRYDGYPYFTVLAGALQWCIYGTSTAELTGDTSFFTMVMANGPGIVFGLFYVSTFLRFVPSDDCRANALHGYLAFGAVLLVIELGSLMLLGEGVIFWFGLLGALGSAQIALSPFKTLTEVLSTRSTSSWPVDLCLWSFIQSCATGGFGFAIGDPWIWIPNVIGVIAAGIQLALVALFWKPEKPSASMKKYGSTSALANIGLDNIL